MKIQLLNRVWRTCLEAARDLLRHDGLEHAGNITFLLMLGIIPAVVFLASLVGLMSHWYLSDESKKFIIESLDNLLLNSQWSLFISPLKPRMLELMKSPPHSFWTLTIISALWTSSSIIEGVRTVLNRAYRVQKAPSYFSRRLSSIFELIIIGVLVIFLLAIFIVIPKLFALFYFKILQNNTDIDKLNSFYLIISSGYHLQKILFLLFNFALVAWLYRFIPSGSINKQNFFYNFPGSIVVIGSWAGFSWIFKNYLTYFPQINIIYGSIVGIIVTLLYFYVCSVIFIFGAEFNYHFALNLKNIASENPLINANQSNT